MLLKSLLVHELECCSCFLTGVQHFIGCEVQNKIPLFMRLQVWYFKVHNRISVQKLQMSFLLHVMKDLIENFD